MTTLVTDERLAEVLADPVTFAEYALGVQLWDIPRAILAAMATPRAKVAVKGCHRSGKTHTLALAVLWWVFSGGRAITTASSGDQVELLWREIRQAWQPWMGGELTTHEWKEGRETLALGRSTDRSERFQGFNHPRVMVIVDEAPGVREPIFEGIEGIRSGGDVRVCYLGNPTLLGGSFYEAFHSEQDSYQTFTINAFSTPNLAGLTPESTLECSDDELESRVKIPGLITGSWVKEKLKDWPEGDPRRASRIFGDFPTQGAHSVYYLTHLDDAKSRPLFETSQRKRAGVDPAGGGADESACQIGQGPNVLETVASPEATGWDHIISCLERHGGPEEFEVINVDADGLGFGLCRELRQLGYTVREVHAQEQADDTERFDRRKDEVHWLLRERLEEGMIAGLTDDTTRAQLSQIRWRLGRMGRVQVESKADLRARGARSPDRAEALMLLFMPGGDSHAAIVPSERVRKMAEWRRRRG